jgi:hypothetical protein
MVLEVSEGVPARLALAAIVLAASAAGVRAEPLLVPGRMGYNALPALRNADPAIGPDLEVEVSATVQVSSLIAARDAAATPYFRVTVPFHDVAAIELDGVPLELFQVSSETQARLGARQRAGITPGDIRVGARFLLLNERRQRPALGVQLIVKTTTGKGLDALRFTNAPGYIFDLLAGKDLLAARPVALRALAKVGFLAWQVGEGRQDDAVDFGATLRAGFASGVSLAAELRGYAGWREDDEPVVLGITASVPAARSLEVRAAVDHGLTRDAPPVEVRLGFVLSLDPPKFGRDR